MDHDQFKVTLKAVNKKFAYTICELELTNLEVRAYVKPCGACEGSRNYIHAVWMDTILRVLFGVSATHTNMHVYVESYH